MKRAAGIALVAFTLVAILLTLLGVGCASDPKEVGTPSQIQELRVNHCERVLKVELCRSMAHRNIYQTIGECGMALDADGFCSPPIASTISEMNDCAVRIGRDWSLPEECLSLRHD